LHPPTAYKKLSKEPGLYKITGAALVQALDHIATQPLPSTKQVFPWLHGLHAENQLQLAFFIARKKSLRRTPKCIRGITVVKAGGDLSHSKLKGAVAPDEILSCQTGDRENDDGDFLEIDPREGFSVRNFQIQACKMATVSDIVVYGDNKTPRTEVEALAKRISRAQALWQRKTGGLYDQEERLFNTFVVSGKWQEIASARACL
jgi:dual specificity MAP kinase phosphatase